MAIIRILNDDDAGEHNEKDDLTSSPTFSAHSSCSAEPCAFQFKHHHSHHRHHHRRHHRHHHSHRHRHRHNITC